MPPGTARPTKRGTCGPWRMCSPACRFWSPRLFMSQRTGDGTKPFSVPGRRSRATAALSLAFVSVVLTGFVLLGVEGGGSSVGLWHYRMGIVVGVLSVGHLLKRIPALRRGSAGR